ncbi:MAG: transposase [Cypionkella sp.]
MAYLGLTPAEHSSGASIRPGGITKAGSGLANHFTVRGALIEGAWSYRMQTRVGPKLHSRLATLPKIVRDTAWKGHADVPALLASWRGRKGEVGCHHGHRSRDGRLHPDYCKNCDGQSWLRDEGPRL